MRRRELGLLAVGVFVVGYLVFVANAARKLDLDCAPLWAGRMWADRDITGTLFPLGRHRLTIAVGDPAAYTVPTGDSMTMHTNPSFVGSRRPTSAGGPGFPGTDVVLKLLCYQDRKAKKGRSCWQPEWARCREANCPAQALASAAGGGEQLRRVAETGSYCGGPQGCGLFRDEIYFAAKVSPSTCSGSSLSPLLDVLEYTAATAPEQIKQYADWFGAADESGHSPGSVVGKDRLYLLVYPRMSEPAFVDDRRLPEREAIYYGLGLLSGLARAHSVGVIHGDIKVDHVLANDEARGYSVIDWDGGIDVREAAGADPAYPRIGSKACYWEAPITHRGAPEIVLDYYSRRRNCTVTPAIDVWEAGVAFASVLLGCPLFAPQKLSSEPSSAPTRLHAIVNLLGTQKLYAAMRKYDNIPKRGKKTSKEMVWALQNMTAEVPAMALKDFIRERTACPAKPQLRPDPDALDLISRMLTWDPADRITAAAAVRHRLFRSVVRRSSAAGRTTALGSHFARKT